MVFSCEFCEIFKNIFLTKYLGVTVSGIAKFKIFDEKETLFILLECISNRSDELNNNLMYKSILNHKDKSKKEYLFQSITQSYSLKI